MEHPNWVRPAIVLATTFACVIVVLPSQATNFGSQGSTGTSGTTSGVFVANNNVHNVAERNLTATYSDGLTSTIDYDYNDYPAALWTNSWEAPSCTSAHDVCAYDSSYGNNGLNGWNACAASNATGSHPDMVCTQNVMKINETYAPPAWRIACHELGHTTGLRHTSDSGSCMKTTSSGGTSKVLTSHDRDHLENEY